MRKLSMKGKRRRSDNNSDGESEENGGAGSNAENSVDATEVDTMPKTKRKGSRGKNNGKSGDDRSETPQNEEADNNEVKVEEENENGHGEKGVARKRRKKEEQKPTTSQDNSDGNEEEDKEYEVEKIVAHRTIKGRRQFLVRWKGYNDDADTWEQEKDLSCPQLIEDFLAEQGSKDEGGETSSKPPKKVDKKGKKAKKTNNVKKENNTKEDNAEYEVERIIDVYFKKNGKREFLIRWKGFKPSEDSWEPEDNLNCPDLIKKFMAKVDEAKSVSPRSLRTNPIHTKRYTLATSDSGRRLSRRNTGKQRATYHHCDE
ncbi:heterochromatin protein 1 [Diachasma alloeum]|uniref:heterochromatin protein 1 n=1 Tax=Diachasma alloeum TaxID=454923 RepID=UPI0007384C3B|nr:heterochromatin protein 1 [Diachasma alloeum]